MPNEPAHTPQEFHPPVEEYLETMLSLAEEGIPVIQARIAERLGRAAPSVSEMLERLIEDGYVSRQGRRLDLTESGRALAEKVVRKHRLAERLLVDVIGLEWHKVHREAGRWEHVISDDVEARLVDLLGDPATCPHGNPIPGSGSVAAPVSTRPLAEVGSGERVRLVRISEEVELNLGSLTLLGEGGFIPGVVAVVGRRDGDDNLEVQVEGEDETLRLSPDLTDRLFVGTRRDHPAGRRRRLHGGRRRARVAPRGGGVHRRPDHLGGRPAPRGRPLPTPRSRSSGGLLMPGLVNCHGHSPMTLVRSAGDGLPLDRWLSESVWPREALHDDDDVFWGMTLGAHELLCNGVTTTCEQYLHPGAVAAAALASGIRCVLTPGVFDATGIDPAGTWQAHLAEACRIFDEMDGREGRLHVGFGPHAAYSLPPDGLSAVAAGGPTPRGHGADPPLGDRSRGPGGGGALRHDRAGSAGLAGRVRRPGAGRPRRLARRCRHVAAWPSTAWPWRTAPAATGSWAPGWPG